MSRQICNAFYENNNKLRKGELIMRDLIFAVTLIVFALGFSWFLENDETPSVSYTKEVADEAIEASYDLNEYLIENYGYCLEE